MNYARACGFACARTAVGRRAAPLLKRCPGRRSLPRLAAEPHSRARPEHAPVWVIGLGLGLRHQGVHFIIGNGRVAHVLALGPRTATRTSSDDRRTRSSSKLCDVSRGPLRPALR